MHDRKAIKGQADEEAVNGTLRLSNRLRHRQAPEAGKKRHIGKERGVRTAKAIKGEHAWMSASNIALQTR